MIAFDIYTPRCVLILGGEIGAQRLSWSEFQNRWCGGRKGMIRARRKGLLHSVHSVQFDRFERCWRVERDCIGRDILQIGPRVALLHSLRDELDRDLFKQMDDIFADRQTANAAANGAATLNRRMGGRLERVAL